MVTPLQQSLEQHILLPAEEILRIDHEAEYTLEDILHIQSRISAKQDRRDYEVPLCDVPLAFYPAVDGGMIAVLGNEKVKVMQTAFNQMAAYMEEAGLGKILEQTAKLDSTASWRGSTIAAFEAANCVLRMWTQRCGKSLRWRIVNRKVNGQIEKVLDAVVSDKYAPLSHVEALEIAADHFGTDRNVIEYRLTTTEMRLRIADEPIQLGKPIKMLEVFNSETGHRSLSFWGRLWKLICSNGMAATLRDHGRARFNHVGEMRPRVENILPEQLIGIRQSMFEGEEIRKQAADVRLAWEGESTSSAGVVEAFITAENERRKVKMNGRQLKAVFDHGVPDETSGEYGTLSFVENAITRGAQELDSMRAQRLMEDIAFDVLQRGLKQRDGDLIHVRPLPAAA